MDPQTSEDWLKLAVKSEMAARLLLQDRSLVGVAWSHAGFAVECTLKAAIHRQHRLNAWPVADSRYRTHDLRKLMSLLVGELDARHEIAAEFATVTQWQRSDMYNPDEFSAPTVAALLDAAFGERGVCQWIRRNFLTTS